MYRVRLDEFEGPLDLLLFFIRRDELDVFDIPIARIADEFLGYVRVMKQVDLDGVGDFIYMAAVLISIKARMLLPAQDEDDENEDVDPRRELVERLLEYVRFKEAADELDVQYEERSRRYVRGAASSQRDPYEKDAPELTLDATVYDLIEALRPMLLDQDPVAEPTHEVVREEFSVENQQEYVLDKVLNDSVVAFRELVQHQSKAFIIATFLAVLEMARQRLITLSLGASSVEFYIMRPDASVEADAA